VSAVQLTSFSSQPPWCLYEGVTCGDVAGIISYGIIQSISLKNLGLTGTLPDSIGDFRSLTFFDISSNNIHGNIPDTVINWHDGITSLSLNANNLTGTIPPAIAHLVHLTALHLHDNNLEGSIPSAVGSLNSLSVLNLGGNSLTGKIPSTIGDMTALQHISLNSNMLVGTIPAQISALSRLIFFDVADNFLSMGSAITLSEAIFSDATRSGTLKLSGNRLAYQAITHPEQNCIATGCFQAAPGTTGQF
jgi:Leucine-rich repeat (LRR) protein